MKYLIIALIGLFSCNTRVSSGEDNIDYPLGDYVVKTVTGCQYLEYTSSTGSGNVVSFTHKRDCNNPVHYEAQYALILGSDSNRFYQNGRFVGSLKVDTTTAFEKLFIKDNE